MAAYLLQAPEAATLLIANLVLWIVGVIVWGAAGDALSRLPSMQPGLALTGALNALAMLTGGAGLLTYGFLIIPVGIGWMIAAGVVLLLSAPEQRRAAAL